MFESFRNRSTLIRHKSGKSHKPVVSMLSEGIIFNHVVYQINDVATKSTSTQNNNEQYYNVASQSSQRPIHSVSWKSRRHRARQYVLQTLSARCHVTDVGLEVGICHSVFTVEAPNSYGKDTFFTVPVNTRSGDGSSVQVCEVRKRLDFPLEDGLTENLTLSYSDDLHLTQNQFKDIKEGECTL